MDSNWSALIAGAKQNDQDAFFTLYQNSYDAVYRSVKSMVRDEDAAMDIVQDAFVKGFDSLDSLEIPDNFVPWMRRIATNKAKDWFKKKHDIAFSQLSDDEDYVPDFEDECVDHLPDVVMDRNETARLIEEILSSLSDQQRLAIGMFYYEEMSVAEIARSLGVSENTVKSRLNYGRKKIKAGVEDLEKKGTKLYSLAPIPFLIWLFRSQASQGATKAAPVAAFNTIMAQTAAHGAVAAGSAAVGASGGLLSTLGAKIIAGVLAVSLIGGGIGLYMMTRDGGGDVPVMAAPSEATRESSQPEETQEPTGAEETQETTQPEETKPEETQQPTQPEETKPGETQQPAQPEETKPEETQAPTQPKPKTSEGLRFTLSDNGNYYSVTGIGTCTDTNLVIPATYNGKPVVSIGQGAFMDKINLTSVTIPIGVTSIGDYAFASCWSLTSVSIPYGVRTIGSEAFAACSSLPNVTLPNSVTRIGSYAFHLCTNLTSIYYNGTTAGWEAITKDATWNDSSGEYAVICTDGTLPKS